MALYSNLGLKKIVVFSIIHGLSETYLDEMQHFLEFALVPILLSLLSKNTVELNYYKVSKKSNYKL